MSIPAGNSKFSNWQHFDDDMIGTLRIKFRFVFGNFQLSVTNKTGSYLDLELLLFGKVVKNKK